MTTTTRPTVTTDLVGLPVRVPTQPGDGGQRGRGDQPAARGAGRPLDAPAGRQRRRRRARHRHRPDRRRADLQRDRQRRLLAGLGRQQAPRPERLRPGAGRHHRRRHPRRRPRADAEHAAGGRSPCPARRAPGPTCTPASASCPSRSCSSRPSPTPAHGYFVSPIISRLWNTAATKTYAELERPEFQPWFDTFAPDGRPPGAGERWSSEGHAARWSASPPAARGDFYEGDLARRRSPSFAAKTGGPIDRGRPRRPHQSVGRADPDHLPRLRGLRRSRRTARASPR